MNVANTNLRATEWTLRILLFLGFFSGTAYSSPLATVNVISPDTTIAANSVVTFGQVFSVGEVSATQSVLATSADATPGNLPAQMDVLRRHPDGSVRHAAISIRVPGTTATTGAASFALSLAPVATTAAGAPAVTITQVTGTGAPVDFRVEIVEHGLKKDGTATNESGKTWTATLKGALTGPVSPWLSGPLACEWRARVAPVSAGTEHPGLRVIFDARYNSLTNGRVSIAIENVESNTARGDRTYDLRIYDATTGGTLFQTQDNFIHYAHTRHRHVFAFGPGQKKLTAIADVTALKRSRAIPNYADVTITEAVIASRYTQWQASARGAYEAALIQPYMPSTGGRWDIGPLPGWTALALISGDPRMYELMYDHAERAGFYNIHWRDSLRAGTTLLNADVFSLDVHPKFSLFNPSSSPTSYVGDPGYNRQGDFLAPPTLPLTEAPGGWSPDRAHQPSHAFVPYLITGDRYFLDELNFWAAWNLVGMAYDYRLDGLGLFKAESQSRGQAWAMRTLGHASWIAPEGAWHAEYFARMLENNFTWFRANIMPGNPLGYWHWVTPGDNSIFNKYELPYSSDELSKVHSPWMHNFVAYTLYELCEKGFAATDLRDMTLGYTVKLFNSGADFNRLDATSYRLPAELTSKVYLTTMADVSAHAFSGQSFAARNPGSPTTLISSGDPAGYTTIHMAILATAVDVTVGDNSGACSGFIFCREQTMANTLSVLTNFLSDPTWNIVPFKTVTGLTDKPGIYPSTSAPAITTQPLSRAVPINSNVTFTVAASGTPPPTFQWRKNGVTIAGATGSSYTIPAVKQDHVGSYTVVATNTTGSVTSNAAALGIMLPPSAAIISFRVE